jgi:hypothetical protein
MTLGCKKRQRPKERDSDRERTGGRDKLARPNPTENSRIVNIRDWLNKINPTIREVSVTPMVREQRASRKPLSHEYSHVLTE